MDNISMQSFVVISNKKSKTYGYWIIYKLRSRDSVFETLGRNNLHRSTVYGFFE